MIQFNELEPLSSYDGNSGFDPDVADEVVRTFRL